MDARLRKIERQFRSEPSVQNLMQFYREHRRANVPFNLLHLEAVADLEPLPLDFFLHQEEHLCIGNAGIPLADDIYRLLDICALMENANTGLYYLKYVPQRLTRSLQTRFAAESPFKSNLTGAPQLVIATGLNDYYYVANAGNATAMRIFPIDASFSSQALLSASLYPNRTSCPLPADDYDTTWNAVIAGGFEDLPGIPLCQLFAETNPEQTDRVLVDYFYSIEDYKHLALHLFKLYLFGEWPPSPTPRLHAEQEAENLGIICDEWDLSHTAGANFLGNLWAATQAAEWASWGEEAADNLNYQLPRLIDTFRASIEFDPQDIVADCGPACDWKGRGFNVYQTPQDVLDDGENASELWEMIKYESAHLRALGE